ncbi:NTP pyrophosphatase (non-canonical NTP hydrolase) [Inquilinus ginsengisoli]|uniref:NTP pyrophosphatase (Non-canonical NTP hydrolase) n=1 Tax=Inquilinus ginsengisoli TaxID=363840 RepID=A0ABU1JMN2_9PROT|nr:MazG nucleotide pyrophosphohydrolase domain-containing protein [Inquilinus ginsengisoli]MDR6288814.1 NTP pyrophosphatase (non-canonical NTP hydrolase) [Inquilinus ginsengisoli]
MLVSIYDNFVHDSDHSKGKPHDERLDIATYGLAAELGSVVAAIKKRFLGEGGIETWNAANEEIIEELGDVVWYCFSLARIENTKKPVNIFTHDIANLKKEISAADERAERIRFILEPSKRDDFLSAAESFPKRTKLMEFEDYQTAAFLTARTKDRTLVEVCLAVLWQLSAQLFRRKLPAIEKELNQAVVDRPINDILGEIAWHVSALASVYQLKLSDVAQHNMDKVSFRLDRRHPTPLHDIDCPPSQQLPRRFEVGFVTVAKGRSRMYMDGRRLGDDLTDNSYDDDGYRFHDIMHLANAAKLGWSPVLRALLGRKRKLKPQTDEVEDGARAKIVEEAVIKVIHSEGERLAELRGGTSTGGPVRLFPSSVEITFRFLKFIRNFVADLEVEKNRYWEWEEAILAGYDIFHRLRCEGQGTVIVDLEARSIDFRPEVYIDLNGKVAGLGSACLDADMFGRDQRFQCKMADAKGAGVGKDGEARVAAQKLAILDALGIRQPDERDLEALHVQEIEGKGICVRASGPVQRAMWDRNVVGFRTTTMPANAGQWYCTAIAIADG